MLRAPPIPLRDIDIINMELILADAEMVTRRVDKAQKAAKGGDKRFLHEGGGIPGAPGPPE